MKRIRTDAPGLMIHTIRLPDAGGMWFVLDEHLHALEQRGVVSAKFVTGSTKFYCAPDIEERHWALSERNTLELIRAHDAHPDPDRWL